MSKDSAVKEGVVCGKETSNYYIELLNEIIEQNDTIIANQEVSLANQEDILEKLDNLSRPGSDFSIDEG